MAKSQFKAGGPTRGRRRVRKIGMGSGDYLRARKEARKGVGVPKDAAKILEGGNAAEKKSES
ncbi:MAG: hypothetical protein AAGA20_06515 [Planctomycetota bacterium]